MLRILWLTCLRITRKQRGYFLLNVIGLTLGLASFLLIHGHVRYERSFDNFHQKADDLYRVALEFKRPGGQTDFLAATNFPATGPALAEYFPEVRNFCRLFRKYHGGVVQSGETVFRESNLWYADSTFFELFSFGRIAGDFSRIKLSRVAFLEERTAAKYFGDDDPIGRRITVGSMDGLEEFEVAGIFRCPINSHFSPDFVFSYESLVALYGSGVNSTWGWYDFYTFIQLNPQADPRELEKKFPVLIRQRGGERLGSERVSFFLQPLRDIHLHSHLTLEAAENNTASLVQMLEGVAVVILVIACINYVNLSGSQSISRSKEVGVRKVIGSSQWYLIMQFMIETFIITGTAAVLAVVVAVSGIGLFNEWTGNALTLSYLFNTTGVAVSAFVIVMTTLLCGLYPAVMISSFQPLVAIKGIARTSVVGGYLRKSLVVLQFMAAFVLIAGTAIALRQVRYMRSLDPGVTLENVILVRTPDIVLESETYGQQLTSFKTLLGNNHGIVHVSLASEAPGEKVGWYAGGRLLNADRGSSTVFFQVSMDEDYIGTYEVPLLAGRNFIETSDLNQQNVIVNATALESFGLNDAEAAINQQVLLGGDTLTIVGVLDNYHHESAKAPFRPTVYRYIVPQELRYIAIRYTGEVASAIESVREMYSSTFPGIPFTYELLTNRYDNQFSQDRTFYSTYRLFAGLAIVVALLGLSGLAAYSIAQRTREISIRKVLGGGNFQMIGQLSYDFVFLVVIGCILGIPLTIVFLENWLAQFASRISMSVVPFIIALCTCVFLACAIVVAHALRVVHINPAQTLKNE